MFYLCLQWHCVVKLCKTNGKLSKVMFYQNVHEYNLHKNVILNFKKVCTSVVDWLKYVFSY